MSAKYPRSFHLPWSPGGTNDDKRMTDVSALIEVPIVITEKCDGSNLAFTHEAVFSRSHAGPPSHPSFDLAKATHATIKHLISPGITVFCEYCYALHSIAYTALPHFCLVFGVRDDSTGQWWSWDYVQAQAADLHLPTAPVLFEGGVGSKKELEELTRSLASKASILGGQREGVVVRTEAGFTNDEFGSRLGKWVRKNHVQTDDHWLHQAIVPQRLKQ